MIERNDENKRSESETLNPSREVAIEDSKNS